MIHFRRENDDQQWCEFSRFSVIHQTGINNTSSLQTAPWHHLCSLSDSPWRFFDNAICAHVYRVRNQSFPLTELALEHELISFLLVEYSTHFFTVQVIEYREAATNHSRTQISLELNDIRNMLRLIVFRISFAIVAFAQFVQRCNVFQFAICQVGSMKNSFHDDFPMISIVIDCMLSLQFSDIQNCSIKRYQGMHLGQMME
jgi:hypothetical protein